MNAGSQRGFGIMRVSRQTIEFLKKLGSQLLATGLLWLLASTALGAEIGQVVIDPSQKHVTVFVGVPKALSDDIQAKLRQEVARREGSRLVDWEAFKRDAARHVAQYIRRNDYPEIDIAQGLTALLERFAGASFGLTWNGGLAFTYNDFVYAERTYGQYLNQPGATLREADRRRDPVHPLNHLEPLLNPPQPKPQP